MQKFFILWVSQAFSLLGSAVVHFALAWYLAKETGSATVLATAVMVSLVPSILLGPFIGPLIDRWDRKKIMILADLSTMFLTVVLVLLFYTKTIQIWHVYAVLAGRSIGDTFQFPALAASIPMIVPGKHLTRANGLYQTLQNAVRITAPPAGAFLLELLHMQEVLAIDIITAIIAVSCLFLLRIPRPSRATLSVKPDYFGDMRQGFRYIMSRRGLMMLIGLVAILMFFGGPAGSLLPVLVNEHLGGDVLKLGWLTSAAGIGGIIAGSVIGAWGGLKKGMMMALLGFSIMVPCSIAIGFTSDSIFYSTVAAMVFLGVGNTFVNSPLTAILNSVIAKDMQGRVFSLYSSVVTGAMLLGLITAGPVADSLDIRSIYWIAAGAWLLIIPLAAFSKSLMDLENHPAEEKAEEES